MRDFLEKHGLWILAAAALIAVALSVSSYLTSTSPIVENLAGIVTSPFRSASAGVRSWMDEKQRYYEDYTALLEENQHLREELASLRANERQVERDRAENARLRELLDLRPQRRTFDLESAMIIERSASNWISALTLNRGTNHGVAVNDCVINSEYSLVGIVSEVGLNWCTVLTIVDTDTELGALVFRTGDVAVAEGDFALMAQHRLRLSYLPPSLTLLIGDYVVTSGLGGFYPPDLVIGTVESVDLGDDGLAQQAVLCPAMELDDLTEVFIIKDFEIVE